jgi:arylsulfatase A-like enzyme
MVVTSDVGQPLAEHGILGGERVCVHTEAIHLPLMVRGPGIKAGRRIQQLSQSIDLLPTLLDLLGLPANTPPGLGKSLTPMLRGESAKLRDYACARARSNGDEAWSLRTHQWYFTMMGGRTAEPSTALYIKPDDRYEVNDVSVQFPDVAEHLELTLRRYREALGRQRLDALPTLRQEVLQVVQS